MVPRLRAALASAALAAAAGLAVAFAAEWYGGLVPCALCLVERWPYRAVVALGLAGLLLPRPIARICLLLLGLAALAGAIAAGVHVGVERGWWPSPLPECAAPKLGGGSLAQRLAAMPAQPSKACEDPTYLIPAIPLSMAMMNLLYSLLGATAVAWFLATSSKARP